MGPGKQNMYLFNLFKHNQRALARLTANRLTSQPTDQTATNQANRTSQARGNGRKVGPTNQTKQPISTNIHTRQTSPPTSHPTTSQEPKEPNQPKGGKPKEPKGQYTDTATQNTSIRWGRVRILTFSSVQWHFVCWCLWWRQCAAYMLPLLYIRLHLFTVVLPFSLHVVAFTLRYVLHMGHPSLSITS